MATSSNAVLLEALQGLRADFQEFKAMFMEHDRQEREFQGQYWQRHADVAGGVKRAHERLDEHETEIRELRAEVKKMTDAIQPLVMTNRILTWLGGALGLSVIALIWALITGQVSLVF